IPPITKDSMMPGPAYRAAAVPVRTKMPAPMMQPIPSAVRLTGPRVLPRAWPSPSAMMSARGFRVIKPWGSGLGVKAWSVIGTSLVSVDCCCCLRLRRDLVLRLARIVMKTPYNNHGRPDAGRRNAVDGLHNVRFTSRLDVEGRFGKARIATFCWSVGRRLLRAESAPAGPLDDRPQSGPKAPIFSAAETTR